MTTYRKCPISAGSISMDSTFERVPFRISGDLSTPRVTRELNIFLSSRYFTVTVNKQRYMTKVADPDPYPDSNGSVDPDPYSEIRTRIQEGKNDPQK